MENNLKIIGPKRIAFLITLSLALIVTIFLSRQIIAYQHYPFDSDEANHALGGRTVAQALAESDLFEAFRQSYGRDFYSPALDWLKALVFLAFGPSSASARFISVACLFLAVLLIYAIGIELDERWGWVAGLVAAVLTLTARPLLVYSMLNMLEVPGLLVSMALLYTYLQTFRRPSSRNLFLTSLLLVLTFLTKYTYGVVAVATLSLMELSRLLDGFDSRVVTPQPFRRRLAIRLRKRWLWLFGPFALLMLLWFSRPDKIATFFAYTRPLSGEQPLFSLRNVLFYLRSVALHQGPGPLFALITLASLLWAAVHWRDPRLRLLLLYFLAGMAAIMLVSHPPNPRFIATFVPAAHLLTGATIAWLGRRWQQDGPRPALAGVSLLLLFALLPGLPVVAGRYATLPSVLEAYLETTPQNNDMAAWIDAQLPDNAAVFVINYWDQFSPPTLFWHLNSQQRASRIAVDGMLLEPANSQTIAALRQELENGRATHLVLLEGGPWGAPFWPDYTAALADRLTPIADRHFTLNMYDAAGYLDHAILEPDTWERAKQESYYQMNVGVIIYKLNE